MVADGAESLQSLELTTEMPNPEQLVDSWYNDLTPAVSALFRELESANFVTPQSSESLVEAYSRPHDYDRNKSGSTDTIRLSEGGPATDTHAISDAGIADSERPGKTVRLVDAQEIRNYVGANPTHQAFFIQQRNSYSALSVSRALYTALSEIVNVPARFVEYFLYFGDRDHEVEIVPVPLRLTIDHSYSEACYCIRFVEINSRQDVIEPSSRWSLRQTAIYHRSNSASKESVWLFITLSKNARSLVRKAWDECGNHRTISPFHIHFLIYRLLLCRWRPYLVALNQEVEQHTERLLGASADNSGPLTLANAGDRSALLLLEGKILSSQVAVNTTKNDISSWISKVQTLRADQDECTERDIDLLQHGFVDLASQLQASSLRLEHLRQRLQTITTLVSNFLDLSNGLALQELAKESRAESEEMLKLNARMHELAEKTTQDSAAVKVLTILTLIYLPVTVVSNFFSTSFVGKTTDGEHINVTSDWWLLVVTSVPLTILTLYIWWIWSNIQACERYPWWWHWIFRPRPVT